MTESSLQVLQTPGETEPSIGAVVSAMTARLRIAEERMRSGRISVAVRDLAAVRADYRTLKPILAAYSPHDEIGHRLRVLSRVAVRRPGPAAMTDSPLIAQIGSGDGSQKTPLCL